MEVLRDFLAFLKKMLEVLSLVKICNGCKANILPNGHLCHKKEQKVNQKVGKRHRSVPNSLPH